MSNAAPRFDKQTERFETTCFLRVISFTTVKCVIPKHATPHNNAADSPRIGSQMASKCSHWLPFSPKIKIVPRSVSEHSQITKFAPRAFKVSFWALFGAGLPFQVAQDGAKRSKIEPSRSKRGQQWRKMEQDGAKVGEHVAYMRQHLPKRRQKGAQGRALEGDEGQTLAITALAGGMRGAGGTRI